MKKEWNQSTLGELCKAYGGKIQTGPFGSQLHQSDYSDDGIPVVMPKDINQQGINLSSVAKVSLEIALRLSRHKLHKDEIVFPRRGEISKCALVKQDQEGFLCGTGCLKITIPSKILNPLFIKYYLSKQEIIEWLDSNAVGATMKNLSTVILEKLPVYYPTLPIQKKIAGILSAYDDLIENNLKRIKLLEEMAQITYEEWFVRLRFPGYESTFIDPITGLPVGWEKRKMSDFCSKVTDGTHDSPKHSAKGYKLVTGKHIIDGFIDFETAYLISEDDHQKIKKRSGLNKGDILFSNIGTLGNTAIVTQDFEFSCKNVIIFKYKENQTNFLYAYLTNRNTQNKFFGQSVGVAQKFFSLNFVRTFEDFFPPSYLVEKFDNYARTIYQLKYHLHDQNQLLREARDILLPRLMTGVIDVENYNPADLLREVA